MKLIGPKTTETIDLLDRVRWAKDEFVDLMDSIRATTRTPGRMMSWAKMT